MNGISEYHSVELKDERCKGCTICVTSCPVEAIRVHDGKAYILEEKCIDCGECIRVCPNRAKYAVSNSLDDIQKYKEPVILVPPTLFTQFNERFSKENIDQALLNLGFSKVYHLEDATEQITKASVAWLKKNFLKQNPLRPIISSNCPAVVKLIQVRFPSLIEHLIPIISPEEACARKIKYLNNSNVGIFYISSCPAKMTVTRFPLGYDKSAIDKVLSLEDLYLPILGALNKNSIKKNTLQSDKIQNSIYTLWCSNSGESRCIDSLFSDSKHKLKWLNASGIKQTIEMLENIEDGTLGNYDFIELNICPGGCLGGPLTINPQPVAEALLRDNIYVNKEFLKKNSNIETLEYFDITPYLHTRPIIPRPSRLLSTDFSKARKMMEEIESILDLLPGFDCGSCGSPNCRALAEDIVRGNAKIDDCIFIMKSQYEKLLFRK
ncbi:MAG: hypothetical protein BKP49_08725 [Treponema sp. CETP13]|nr:MAG: hypothetical protein BKP49_08725 [Treponema sp. CETP13]